jgi:hypothetical protein
MPTIKITINSTKTSKACIAQWAGLTSGADGDQLDQSQYTDKSVQVSGVFGVGGTLQLLGSNDGVNWNLLTDPQGNALNITGASIKFISEATHYIKPLVVGGDGTTLLIVTILLKE